MKFSSILSRFSKIAIFSAAAVVLSACGQRGPLIHPDKDKALGKTRTTQNNAAPNTTSPAAASQAQQSTSQNASQPDATAPAPTDDVRPSTSGSDK